MNRSIQIFRRISIPLVVALVAFGLFAPTASAANTAVIAGTVRAQQTGDPLPGATVSVYLTPNVTTPVATATTAIDGSYQVGTLAAGTYKVRFSADATTFVQSWYWFADTAADATAISMADGDQVNWVDGYLSDATTSVAGTRVRDTTPPPACRVSSSTCSPRAIWSIRCTPRRPRPTAPTCSRG